MKRRGRRPTATVGFIITPDAIKDRINALDNAIAKLDGDIRASKAPRLNTSWRTEWDAFVRRWTVERDSFASWSSRLFATYAMPRIEAFETNYRFWARQYEERTGKAPAVAPRAEQETLLQATVPTAVWWLLATGLGVWILSRQARKSVGL